MSDTHIQFDIQLDTDIHKDDANVLELIYDKNITALGYSYHLVSCMFLAESGAANPVIIGLSKTKVAKADLFGRDAEERYWEARDVGRALADEFGANPFDYLIHSCATWTSPSNHSQLPPRLDPDRRSGIMTTITDLSELNTARTTEEYLYAVENLDTRIWFTEENAQGELVTQDADCYAVNEQYMQDRGLDAEDHPRYKVIQNYAMNSCLVGLSPMFRAISTKYNSPEKMQEMIEEINQLVDAKEAKESETTTSDT